ncbi:glutathione S-transferase [Pacificimonas flava]|uniref:Glutathione S-transferase n=1 Tax=Pacificimonas flava TaxID=1234595 RepID=M2U4V1_9SPHN|nr:glutathione S-transferase [Pacificimonas flava]EMD83062.1 Glutathione S-transferase [Pacificimonas flava]MBB5280218.1 glutathione S-transferase [Pacificimonas flava]
MSYDLWYWAGLPGRGEFVRIALEAGGIPYRERGREEGTDVAEQLERYDSTPPYAPPWLDTGELVLAQTANILLYLGDRHGLAPKDAKGKLWVNQLQLTIMDMVAEAHDTHHPIADGAYYEEQKEAAKQAAEQFRGERMPKFFRHFAKTLNGERKFFAGEAWSYADTSFYVLMSGLEFAFPQRMATLRPEYRSLFEHRDRVGELPELQDYLASDRCLPFENGLFRHYEELDASA